jgi:hypothetical protein
VSFDPDKTPRWDAESGEPDPYLRIVLDVLAACDRKQAPIDAIRDRAETIRTGLAGWKASRVLTEDRALDVEAAFRLLDDARKAGLFE